MHPVELDILNDDDFNADGDLIFPDDDYSIDLEMFFDEEELQELEDDETL